MNYLLYAVLTSVFSQIFSLFDSVRMRGLVKKVHEISNSAVNLVLSVQSTQQYCSLLV